MSGGETFAACLAAVLLALTSAAALSIALPSRFDALTMAYGVFAGGVGCSFFLFRFAGGL